jgi:16S rRNA (uracil1498-N3)-methyltransferase
MSDAAPGFLHLRAFPAVGQEFEPDADEAHYLSRVVRARPGERVTASDGRGAVATLEVLVSRPEVRLRVLARESVTRASVCTLLCGAPEGDRADWLIEKLGELGVAVFQPVHTARAEWERADARRERWQRLAVAALRQSRSAWLLEIREPVALSDWLAQSTPVPAEGERRLLASPAGARAPDAAAPTQGVIVGAVGPSPGFSEDELKRLQMHGFESIALAGNRLRTETAAMALATWWAAADTPAAPRRGAGPA